MRINSALRDGKTDDPAVTKLDAAISKGTIPGGTTLFRGMSVDAAKKLFPGGNINVGDTVSDPGYASTSKSQDVAASWGIGGVMLKVAVSKDAKGLDMAGLTRNDLEEETLLPRDAKMRVTRITKGKAAGSPVVVEVSYGD